MAGHPDRNVECQVDDDVGKEPAGKFRIPGMQQNPEWVCRERDIRKTPRVQRPVEDQEDDCREDWAQNSILAPGRRGHAEVAVIRRAVLRDRVGCHLFRRLIEGLTVVFHPCVAFHSSVTASETHFDAGFQLSTPEYRPKCERPGETVIARPGIAKEDSLGFADG